MKWKLSGKSYLVIFQIYELLSREREWKWQRRRESGRGGRKSWDLPHFFLFAKLKCHKLQAGYLPRKPSFISSIELKSWCFSEDHILVSQPVLSQLFKIRVQISRTWDQNLKWDLPICLPLTSSEMSLFNFPKCLTQPGVFIRLQWQRALQKKYFYFSAILAFPCSLSFLVLLKGSNPRNHV